SSLSTSHTFVLPFAMRHMGDGGSGGSSLVRAMVTMSSSSLESSLDETSVTHSCFSTKKLLFVWPFFFGKFCIFLQSNGAGGTTRSIKAKSASPAEGSSRSVLAGRRPGRPGPRSNYELFNYNNLNIRYWRWNYCGCWHQTCPPMDPR